MTLHATKFGPLKKKSTPIDNFFIQKSSSPDLDDISVVYESKTEKKLPVGVEEDNKTSELLGSKKKFNNTSSKKRSSKKEVNLKTDVKQQRLDFTVPALRKQPPKIIPTLDDS